MDKLEEISIIPHIERKSTSYWLDPVVSKMFREKCNNLGLRTCNVIEPFMVAFIGVSSKAKAIFQPMTISTLNLNVNRVVRRADKFFNEVRDVPLVEDGSFSECCVCGVLPVVRACLEEPHQESIRFLCENHFYEHLDTYKKLKFWKDIRPYHYSYKNRSITGVLKRRFVLEFAKDYSHNPLLHISYILEKWLVLDV